VNRQFSEGRAPLSSGDRSRFFPRAVQRRRYLLSGLAPPSEKICAHWSETGMTKTPRFVESQAPPEGAVVVFEGIVRNHFRQPCNLSWNIGPTKPWPWLNGGKSASNGAKKFSDPAFIRHGSHHRYCDELRKSAETTSVLVVVFSRHRAVLAFDACVFCIDTLNEPCRSGRRNFPRERAPHGRMRNPFRISNLYFRPCQESIPVCPMNSRTHHHRGAP